jgi:DNA-binding CsgD family transcriptional regulator
MDKCRVGIVIIEPSEIICEGLTGLLLKSEHHYYIYKAASPEELSTLCAKEEISMAIINPVVFINKATEFNRLKKTYSKISWIGLIYSYFDNGVISKFDEVIHISDPAEIIKRKLTLSVERCHDQDPAREELSDREEEVLAELVKGYSNKEIADKLNISIHTVISHRKNIVEKTGIRSLPGLTIYAISRKIIPLDSNNLS